MNKKFAIFYLLIVIPLLIFSQSNEVIDSIYLNALNAKNDSLKVIQLNDIVWETMFNEQGKALKIAKEALKIAKKSNNPYIISDSYNTLGAYYTIISDFYTSIKYHEKALSIRLKLKDKLAIMKSYNNLGSAKKEIGNHQEEIDYYFKALNITEELKDTISQTKIEMNIADALIRQQQFEEAEKYFIHALELLQILGDVNGQISCYIGLGNLHHNTGKFNRSIEYFIKVEKLVSSNTNNYILAKYHANYAALLKDISEENKAIKHIQESIKLNDKIGNTNSNLVNYINLAAIYESQKKTLLAKKTYLNALKIAMETGSKQWQKQAYLGIATTSYDLGDFKIAFDNYEKYAQLKDTLQGDEITTAIEELKTKYETQKKENEINLLQQSDLIKTTQIKTQKAQLYTKNILIISSIFVILVIVVSIYFILQKQKSKNELEKALAIKVTEETERLRIAKDIHDDLGSGLSKINFLSELIVKDKNLTNETTENVQSIAETSIKIVENMRDLIWILNPENTTLFGLVSRIREYSSDYLEDYPAELTFNFPNNVSETTISKESYREIFMTIKEALNNIVKHAKATIIEIQIELKNSAIEILIKDNGIGIVSNDSIKSNFLIGNGLKNMRYRIESIGGLFKLESNANIGTIIKILISLEKIKN